MRAVVILIIAVAMIGLLWAAVLVQLDWEPATCTDYAGNDYNCEKTTTTSNIAMGIAGVLTALIAAGSVVALVRSRR